MKAKKLAEVAPEIEIADYWHPETLSRTSMLAYKRMEILKQIQILKIEISKSTHAITVRYKSTIPKEMIHRELQQIKTDIETNGEQMVMSDIAMAEKVQEG